MHIIICICHTDRFVRHIMPYRNLGSFYQHQFHFAAKEVILHKRKLFWQGLFSICLCWLAFIPFSSFHSFSNRVPFQSLYYFAWDRCHADSPIIMCVGSFSLLSTGMVLSFFQSSGMSLVFIGLLQINILVHTSWMHAGLPYTSNSLL